MNPNIIQKYKMWKLKKKIRKFKNIGHSGIILCGQSLTKQVGEACEENNQNGCHLKNIGQSDFNFVNTIGISIQMCKIWNFYD